MGFYTDRAPRLRPHESHFPSSAFLLSASLPCGAKTLSYFFITTNALAMALSPFLPFLPIQVREHHCRSPSINLSILCALASPSSSLFRIISLTRPKSHLHYTARSCCLIAPYSDSPLAPASSSASCSVGHQQRRTAIIPPPTSNNHFSPSLSKHY